MTDGVIEARTALRVTDGGFFSLNGEAELRAVADAAGRGLAVSLDRGGNVRLSDTQLVRRRLIISGEGGWVRD